MARVAFNKLTRSWSEKLGKERGISEQGMNKIKEEIWVLSGNLIMICASFYIMLQKNNGCWFGSTVTCLTGWPNLSLEKTAILYYDAELAWYVHLLLKKPLRYGEPDGIDMMIHHTASLLLLLLSKALHLTRAGILVLTLFGISNPALHVAKICNQLFPSMRIVAFGLFSALFFITRVILVPPVILKMTILEAREVIPYAVKDFYPAYITFNVLLVALYMLQLQWMFSIFKVLKKSASEGSDAAANLSNKLDPSKRFASSLDEKDE